MKLKIPAYKERQFLRDVCHRLRNAAFMTAFFMLHIKLRLTRSQASGVRDLFLDFQGLVLSVVWVTWFPFGWNV